MAKGGDNSLLIIAVLAVIISAVGMFVTYNNLFMIENVLLAPNEANVTVEIQSNIEINFTNSEINWGAGSLDGGEVNATLSTARGAAGVDRGTWSNVEDGFVLVNIGTSNVSLELASNETNASFIGGLLGEGPQFFWNVSNCFDLPGASSDCVGPATLSVPLPDDDSRRACGAPSQGISFGENLDVNNTGTGSLVCDQFGYEPAGNELRIDILLTIPADTPKTDSGANHALLTATATQSP
jgi:hypothetical protein